MDRAILIGSLLISLTFILSFTISAIAQTNYSFFIQFYGFFNAVTLAALASFPIGTLIIVLRIMQWAKFKLHKGTLFGLTLILSGFVIFVSLENFIGKYYFVLMGAILMIFIGIIILTIKTALWGSKYINNNQKSVV